MLFAEVKRSIQNLYPQKTQNLFLVRDAKIIVGFLAYGMKKLLYIQRALI